MWIWSGAHLPTKEVYFLVILYCHPIKSHYIHLYWISIAITPGKWMNKSLGCLIPRNCFSLPFSLHPPPPPCIMHHSVIFFQKETHQIVILFHSEDIVQWLCLMIIMYEVFISASNRIIICLSSQCTSIKLPTSLVWQTCFDAFKLI